MSKGSKQRPIKDKEQFDKNWDEVFGKKEKDKQKKSEIKNEQR